MQFSGFPRALLLRVAKALARPNFRNSQRLFFVIRLLLQGPSQGMAPHGMPPHPAYLAGPGPHGARGFQHASFPGAAPHGYTTQYMGEPEMSGGSRQRQYLRSAPRGKVDRAKDPGEKLLISSDKRKAKPTAQEKTHHQSKSQGSPASGRPTKEAKSNKRTLDEENSSKSTKTADVSEQPGAYSYSIPICTAVSFFVRLRATLRQVGDVTNLRYLYVLVRVGRAAKQRRTRSPVLKPSKVKSVLGAKDFSRLRNMMIQQQETFTHQVWELRRLMKQQAIAEHVRSGGLYAYRQEAENMQRRLQHADGRSSGLSPQVRDSYRRPSGKAEQEVAHPSAGRPQHPGSKKSFVQSKQEALKPPGKSSEQTVPKKIRAEGKQYASLRQPDEPRASPKQRYKSMDATVRAPDNSSSPVVRGRDSSRDPQWQHPMVKRQAGEIPPGPDGSKPPFYGGAPPMHAYDYPPYKYMVPPPGAMMPPPPMMASMGPPRPYGPMPPPMDPYALQQYMTAMHQHGMYPGPPPRGY